MLNQDLTESLMSQVAEAAQRGSRLYIQGGNSKTFLGRQVQAESILDVSQHVGIVDYSPTELVVTVRAGTPVADVRDTLAQHGQLLPFEPAELEGKATIGGTVATNLSGPARPYYGAVRDAVLGMRLINGKGQHLHFGGVVMKNVAGYDVSRLQAGAYGTLGVITEVSLRLLPAPELEQTIAFDCGLEAALGKLKTWQGLPKPITAAAWWQGRLYVRLAGAEAAVSGTRKEWGGDLEAGGADFWRQLREFSHPGLRLTAAENDRGLRLWRYSLPPAAAVSEMEEGGLIDWGGALRWLKLPGELEQHVPSALQRQGSVSQIYSGLGSSNSPTETFQPLQPRVQQLHLGLKAAFDPQGIFNPGKLYSWL